MTHPKPLLLVLMEPPAGMEAEFNDWYDTEHLPERPACQDSRPRAAIRVRWLAALPGLWRPVEYRGPGRQVLPGRIWRALQPME